MLEVQVGVPFAGAVHFFVQEPQLLMSAVVEISQPLSALPSQSA